jgi:hypothetical protein
MRLSAIALVDSATQFLGAHLDRVVRERAGGVDDVEMLLHKYLQVMRSRRVVDENEYLWINLARSSLQSF